MNKKPVLIIIPVFFSIFLLGGRLPNFKLHYHSKPRPVIKGIEEPASEDYKSSVVEVDPGISRFDLSSEKTRPFAKTEKFNYKHFKSVSIVARPPPASFY